MKLYKTVTLKWWQAAYFKIGMYALGISIGAYWHTFFAGYMLQLLIIAAVCLGYVTYIWSKQ